MILNLIFLVFFPADSIPAGQSSDSVPQRDIVDLVSKHFKKKEKIDTFRKDRKVYFSIVPGASSVPGGGTAVVTAFSSSFYTGDRRNTNISNVLFTPYFTFSEQYVLPLKANVWLPDNKFNILGDIRYMKYPQYNWGLGPETPEEDKTLIDYYYHRAYITLMRKIAGHLAAGFGYNLDLHYNITEDQINTESHLASYPYGTGDRSISSGISISVQYDARVNPVNPKPGAYGWVSLRVNPVFMGSDYNWNSLFTDLRKYISLSGNTLKSLVATRFYYWTTLSKEVPYLDLPAIGWEPISRGARGFRLDRHRSNAILYGEGEWRINLSRNGLFGMVLFANIHSVSELNTQNFSYWYPAGGTGIRIKFNKYSGTNIGVDLGFSKEYIGVYLWLGEVF